MVNTTQKARVHDPPSSSQPEISEFWQELAPIRHRIQYSEELIFSLLLVKEIPFFLLMSIIFEDDDEDKGPQWAEEDTVSNIVKESVENVLKTNDFEKDKIASWTTDIGDRCLRGLSSLQKPLKFIVEVTVMQKNGAGLHSASACYWDATQDGAAFLRWENETIHCLVCVIGVGI